ncbi:MAG: MBL fold metallo-hydrolase [Actinomycetia bacterium]|nr:MBL fold metallo-hydrolase [Actinomycetes bacterium]
MRIETVELQVYRQPGFITNCYLLYDQQFPEFLMVVDPGDDYPCLKKAIGKRKVISIVCTHHHYDHVAALADLKADTNAPIFAHRIEAQSIIASVADIASKRRKSWKRLVIDHLLESGDWITMGSEGCQVLHTPGHSKGSICLSDAAGNALISGDTLFFESFGRTDLAGGSDSEMRQSLMRLSTFDDGTVVYPGHGPSTTIGHERAKGTLNLR